MERYNYAELLGKMREKGFTQEEMAKTIGISAVSMNMTLNNKRAFRQNEIYKATQMLEILGEDIGEYFFSAKT